MYPYILLLLLSFNHCGHSITFFDIAEILHLLIIAPPNNTPVTTRPPSVELFEDLGIINRGDLENATNGSENTTEYISKSVSEQDVTKKGKYKENNPDIGKSSCKGRLFYSIFKKMFFYLK